MDAAGSRAAGAPMLVVTDIVKRFGDGDDSLLAVDRVSFDIAEGEFVSIIGPSGCGKSTLFNIIGGLVADYDGRVAVDGQAVSGTHPAFGMVFQDESAFPWRSVIDNVAFPLELAGLPKRERHEQARRFVSMVGLDGFERRFPAELSGGMRQRVAIARAFAVQPSILLADEAFGHLDEVTAAELRETFLSLARECGSTAILITHQLEEAISVGDRIIVLGRAARLLADIDVARWEKREFAILREAIQATLQNNAQDLRLMRA
jgi:NitT/TauT family transport system ATP-binding protein